jgi:hypothetical protein
MFGREVLEASQSLQTLPLGCHRTPATPLVGRDHDVHEPLEEVPLARVTGAPRELERLVRLEELAGPREPQATLVFE